MIEKPAAFHHLARIMGAPSALEAAIVAALGVNGIAMVSGSDDAQQPDVLVFVAKAGDATTLASTSAEDLSGGLGGELKAAYFALRTSVTAMRANGHGGSAVLVAPPSDGHRSFDALRQGLRLLTKSAALELGPEGIRVNIVLPGSGETPLGRACTDADIAAGVAFAASDQAHFMTGADLVIDGGRMVQ